MSTEKGGAAGAVTMPGGVRSGLIWAAVALAVVAAAGNFGHVFDFATSPDHGDTGQRMGAVVALLPDVTLILCLIKLRFTRWYVPAWVGLALSVAFVAYGSVRMTSGVDGRIVALTPLAAACVAALLLELDGSPTVQPAKAKRSTERSTAAAPERVKPQVSPPVDPVRKPAPLRSVDAGADRSERAKALRAQGLTWDQVAAELRVSKSTAKRLAA